VHHDKPGQARKRFGGITEKSLLRQVRRKNREAATDQPGGVSAARRAAGEENSREARYMIFMRLARLQQHCQHCFLKRLLFSAFIFFLTVKFILNLFFCVQQTHFCLNISRKCLDLVYR